MQSFEGNLGDIRRDLHSAAGESGEKAEGSLRGASKEEL
jgi:hypothetical protein